MVSKWFHLCAEPVDVSGSDSRVNVHCRADVGVDHLVRGLQVLYAGDEILGNPDGVLDTRHIKVIHEVEPG